MATQPAPGTPLVRPIRPDRLGRVGPLLRSRLLAAGVSRPDAGPLGRGILTTARLTRAYLDEVRALVRSTTPGAAIKALRAMGKATGRLEKQLETLVPVVARALESVGDGEDVAGLAEVWFRGGGPRELAAESRLRRTLLEHLSSMGQVRISDVAHLACLWSDAQRLHAALREVLNGSGARAEIGEFLEAISGSLLDHVLPVDLAGLPGDPGLRAGIPAIASRIRE